MPKEEKNSTGRPFFKRLDLLIIGGLLLAAGVWLAVTLLAPRGAVAQVTVGYTPGETTFEVPLSRDDIIEIDAELPVRLEVKDGAIRFIDSVCPDHRCEGFGWLSREGEWALCAPAGVHVRVVV